MTATLTTLKSPSRANSKPNRRLRSAPSEPASAPAPSQLVVPRLTAARPPVAVERSDPLDIPLSALPAEVRARASLVPWLMEGSLAAVVAVGIGVSGIATTTNELATILFSVSLTGLVVLLMGEAGARRRWMVK
jgi:uncharacterized membrane protein YtjA (UPF0391 family)